MMKRVIRWDDQALELTERGRDVAPVRMQRRSFRRQVRDTMAKYSKPFHVSAIEHKFLDKSRGQVRNAIQKLVQMRYATVQPIQTDLAE